MLVTVVFKRYGVFYALTLIFIISLFIRFYKLDTIPKGALVDEASYGYIAYSLLHTGKDERGVTMPLHFQAFGDEKLPAYAYTLIPVIKAFGLNNFSTRLPSALAGALLVLVMYGLLRTMDFTEGQSLFGSFVVALSPWTIVLSRFAFESNLALLLFTAGLWSMFASFQSHKLRYPVFTVLLFACTWYTYVPYRITTTILLFVFMVFLWKRKLSSSSQILGLIFLTIILVAPLLPQTFSKSGTTRLNQVGLFTNSGIVHSINERRGYCEASLSPTICKLLANKPLVIASQILSNQIRALSAEYLFLSAEKDILYLSVADYGVFPIFLLPFFVGGIVVLLRRARIWKSDPIFLIILIGLLAATLPCALVGPPQRVRISALLPFATIIIGMGYGLMLKIITHSSLRLLFQVLSLITIFVLGVAFIIDLYFVHIPKFKLDYASEVPGVMQYIFEKGGERRVYFEKFNDNFPIFYAYFNKIDPVEYQNSTTYSAVDSGGFSHPIGYKNLMRPTQPLDEIICDAYVRRESFYYVTSEATKNMGAGIEKPVYTEMSGDGRSVVSYVYLFDSTKYRKPCSTQ